MNNHIVLLLGGLGAGLNLQHRHCTSDGGRVENGG